MLPKDDIARAVAGPELAAFVLVATGRARVALSRRGVRGWALEDCVQEVLVAVTEHWPRIRGYSLSARYGYLHAVCRGTASSWIRRARRNNVLFEYADPAEHADPHRRTCPESAYSGARVRSTLRACLVEHGPDVQMTFLLVYVAGHTEAEAAEMQGIPLGTVASRLRRVRARLRETLQTK